MTISSLHPDLQKNGNDIHDHVMGAPVCDAAGWLNMTTSALPGRPRANHMVVLVVNFMGVNCPETSGTVPELELVSRVPTTRKSYSIVYRSYFKRAKLPFHILLL